MTETAETASRRDHGRRSLLALGAYALLLLTALPTVSRSNAAYWWAVAGLVVVTAVTVLASGQPLAFYGLTWRGSARALRSAVLSTALLVAGGWVLLEMVGGAWSWRAIPAAPDKQVQLALYLVLAAPLQELVFRGVFQSSARYLLGEGARASAIAVGVSSLAFAACHLPWGLSTALLMLVPGLVWSIQLERDRTLVGVIASHVVVGYLFVGATPLWAIMIGAR